MTANDDLLFDALMLVNLCVHLRTHVHVYNESLLPRAAKEVTSLIIPTLFDPLA